MPWRIRKRAPLGQGLEKGESTGVNVMYKLQFTFLLAKLLFVLFANVRICTYAKKTQLSEMSVNAYFHS